MEYAIYSNFDRRDENLSILVVRIVKTNIRFVHKFAFLAFVKQTVSFNSLGLFDHGIYH